MFGLIHAHTRIAIKLQPTPDAHFGRAMQKEYRAWVFTMQTSCKHPVKIQAHGIAKYASAA
jgi:hypothetical protein